MLKNDNQNSNDFWADDWIRIAYDSTGSHPSPGCYQRERVDHHDHARAGDYRGALVSDIMQFRSSRYCHPLQFSTFLFLQDASWEAEDETIKLSDLASLFLSSRVNLEIDSIYIIRIIYFYMFWIII